MNPILSFFQGHGIECYGVEQGDDFLSFSLNVQAKPGSKVEKMKFSENGNLVVFVKAKPIEGQANKAITKFVTKSFGIGGGSFALDSGEKSKIKRFRIVFSFTERKNVDYYLEKLKKTFL